MSKSSRDSQKRQEWKNERRKYWRAVAAENQSTGLYSHHNLNRMKLGQPPRRMAELQHRKTGLTIASHVPVELHHVFGLNEEPMEQQTFVELFPWDHSACDPDRHFNFQFVRFLGGF